jgi:hypothetical protein
MTGLRSLLIVLSLCAAAPALAGDLAERLLAVDGSADYLSERDALVLDATVSNEDLALLVDHLDWRVSQQAGVALGWREEPALFAAVMQAQPIRDRAGRLRYLDVALAEPAAFHAVLERFRHGDEPLPVREGLFAALLERSDRWPEVVRGLLADEVEPSLRVVMVGSMRQAPDAAVALDVLRQGLLDPDPTVRAEAAVSAGWRADGKAIAPELLAALGDEAVAPRAMAARALGWLAVPGAVEPLSALLSDGAADVRLHALRSLRRLDAVQAKALPSLPALLSDPDPRVVKQARIVAATP